MAWWEFITTVLYAPSSVPGGNISSPRLLRQLWGLGERCERAMRATAPHWQAQKDSWGEAACLFERLALPAHWICDAANIERQGALSLPEPVIQLLASSIATVLKAARVAGVDADFLLPRRFVSIPSLWRSITGVLPAAISLLIPRMAGASNHSGASSTLISAARAAASVFVLSQYRVPEYSPLMVLGSCHMGTLVNRATAELLRCSGTTTTTTTTRREAHFSVGSLSQYAAYLSSHIAFRVSDHCGSAPCAGSPPLSRDLLARPLLHLLHSPLLDTLVMLQHVMVGTFSLQQRWESDKDASNICRMHQTLASMDPDAMDSQVAMQVGHTYYS